MIDKTSNVISNLKYIARLQTRIGEHWQCSWTHRHRKNLARDNLTNLIDILGSDIRILANLDYSIISAVQNINRLSILRINKNLFASSDKFFIYNLIDNTVFCISNQFATLSQRKRIWYFLRADINEIAINTNSDHHHGVATITNRYPKTSNLNRLSPKALPIKRRSNVNRIVKVIPTNDKIAIFVHSGKATDTLTSIRKHLPVGHNRRLITFLCRIVDNEITIRNSLSSKRKTISSADSLNKILNCNRISNSSLILVEEFHAVHSSATDDVTASDMTGDVVNTLTQIPLRSLKTVIVN